MFALIQYEQNIYLVNYNVASEELFYQIVLHEFCNMGHLKLSVPVSIRECLQIALDEEEDLPEGLQDKAEIIEVSLLFLSFTTVTDQHATQTNSRLRIH